MNAFDIRDVLKRNETGRHEYEEFFRSEWLSLAVAMWPAEAKDEQRPHTEDEVYYVVEGRGTIAVADEEQAVGPGSVVFVAAGVEHHFDAIEEDLKVLVFWAPPRHARA
jgi:mannose-6-phosphate isomerase-like protein (cupin superfamily)